MALILWFSKTKHCLNTQNKYSIFSMLVVLHSLTDIPRQWEGLTSFRYDKKDMNLKFFKMS